MPFNNGWLISDAGLANVTTGVIATPRYYGGAAYNDAGARSVTADAAPVATDVYIGGTRHNESGSMYYVTVLPSPAYSVEGIVHNSTGAIYLSSSAAQQFLAAKGVRDDGALCVVFV